jgi:hypothetical protein
MGDARAERIHDNWRVKNVRIGQHVPADPGAPAGQANIASTWLKLMSVPASRASPPVTFCQRRMATST